MTGTHDDQGFTLIELLVAMVISGIVGSVMLTGVVRSLDVTSRATTRVDALTGLQQSVERMSRNIRAADPVTAATGTSLSFTVYDDVTRRTFTYTHVGTQITQTVRTFPNHFTVTPTSTTNGTVATSLNQGTTTVFAYYRDNGTTWTSGPVAEIARIEMRLRHANPDGAPIPLTSSVFLRNLRR